MSALRIHAPELDGALAWFNVDHPLRMSELRGQVVILDFWTYCCINCMHVLPVLAALEQRHRDDPLQVIGIHSAKFAAEKDPSRILMAIGRYQVHHPVAVDSEMRIWQSYAVRSWPTLVIIRPDGTIAAVAPGEPDPALLARFVSQQLQEARMAGTLAPRPLSLYRPDVAGDRPLRYPGKVAGSGSGLLAVADSGHHRVLVLRQGGSPDVLDVVAVVGSGMCGLRDGPIGEAELHDPQGVAWDGDELLIADTGNHAIRRVTGLHTIFTVAGTGKLGTKLPREPQPARDVALRSPWDLCVLPGTGQVVIAMAGSHQLCLLRQGAIGVLAGSGVEALIDGPPVEAAFAQPSGLSLSPDGRVLYVADSETSAVRAMCLPDGPVTTLLGHGLFDFGDQDGPAAQAQLQHCLAVLAHGQDVLVADTYNGRLKLVQGDAASGHTVRTLPLRASAGGAEVRLKEPAGLAWLADGRLVIADTNAHRLVAVDLHTLLLRELSVQGAPVPLHGVSVPEETVGAPPPVAVDWFSTVLSSTVEALRAGEGDILLHLLSPEGEEIAPGSPLRVSLEVSRRSDLLLLGKETLDLLAEGTRELRVPISVRVAELSGKVESEVLLRADFIACRKGEAAACMPGRIHLRLPVRLDPGGGTRITFQARLPRTDIDDVRHQV